MLKKFLQWQYNLSMAFDKAFIDKKYRVYGTSDFIVSVMPEFLTQDARVIEVGGGKSPRITAELKKQRGLKITGLDIDESELKLAPPDIYDQVLVADITREKGNGDYDGIVCRSLLEHVENTEKAIANMSSFLKPGGRLLAFAPCRNAAFARLNLVMPEKIKRKLIDYLYNNEGKQAELMGFRAYYDRCTPSQIQANAEKAGFKVIEKRLYYMSNYFAFFTPVYILWRFYQFLIIKAGWEDFCEGFSFVFERK
ncbi:MAG TPA: class I SAM-dependent methyltransferase [Alphaproteobacteria bacterium]|nr:class I SAM-dependent methyltransferase [Alphaproteobacteria bacterium]